MARLFTVYSLFCLNFLMIFPWSVVCYGWIKDPDVFPLFDWRRVSLHSCRRRRGSARLSSTRLRQKPDQPDTLAPCASLSPGPDIGLLRVTDQMFSGLVRQAGFLISFPLQINKKTRASGVAPEARVFLFESGIGHIVVGDAVLLQALALLSHCPLLQLVQVGEVGVGRKDGVDLCDIGSITIRQQLLID